MTQGMIQGHEKVCFPPVSGTLPRVRSHAEDSGPLQDREHRMSGTLAYVRSHTEDWGPLQDRERKITVPRHAQASFTHDAATPKCLHESYASTA